MKGINNGEANGSSYVDITRYSRSLLSYITIECFDPYIFHFFNWKGEEPEDPWHRYAELLLNSSGSTIVLSGTERDRTGRYRQSTTRIEVST